GRNSRELRAGRSLTRRTGSASVEALPLRLRGRLGRRGVESRRARAYCRGMETDREEHWTSVYRDKQPDAVSWYQPSPSPSLQALARAGATSTSRFIDIGGGASSLVDALLAQGWQDLTVL